MMQGLFGLFRLDREPAPSDEVLRRLLSRGGQPLRAHRRGPGALVLSGGAEGSALWEEPGLVVGLAGHLAGVDRLQTELETCAPPIEDGDAALVASAYRRWGEDCTRHLAGPFAAAIFDAARNSCLLIRDAFGRWPLYVRLDEQGLAFGTRLTPMLKAGLFPRVLDPAAATAYFRYGFIPSPMTLLRGVRLLGAGARLLIAEGGARFGPGRVRLDAPDDITALDRHEAEARALLRESVGRRFEARADLAMPLAPTLAEQVLLRLLPPRTRSLGPELPEGDAAARAAQLADRSYAELRMAPDAGALDRVAEAHELPRAGPDGFRVDAALRWAKRNGAELVDATGGDQLFAADARYPEILVQDAIRRSLPRRIQRLGARRFGARLLGTTEEDLFGSGPGIGLLGEDFRLGVSSEPALAGRSDGTVASLQQLDLEQGVGAGQAPLRRALSELHGVALAMPLLDESLAKVVGRWPLRARTEGPEAGVGLRRIGRSLFSPFSTEPAGIGGDVVDAWLRGPLREPAEAVLFGREGGVSGILHARRVRRLWYAHQLGRGAGRRLLALLMFEWACHRLFERTH
jgi:asparagine synthase (glutamine-hydrolysing)